MTMFERLADQKYQEQKRKLFGLKSNLQKAGLLRITQCPSCAGERLVLTHMVVDPKGKDPVYQLITPDFYSESSPISLICSSCGLVCGTMIRDSEEYAKGLSVQELNKL